MVDAREIEPQEKGKEWVAPTQEAPRSEEQNLEVESWITKIEKRFARIPKGVPGPQDDNVVVTQPQSKQPPVNLPVTQQQLDQNQKTKPTLSIAWLVAWAIRQIKILTKSGRKIKLEEIPVITEKQKEEAR